MGEGGGEPRTGADLSSCAELGVGTLGVQPRPVSLSGNRSPSKPVGLQGACVQPQWRAEPPVIGCQMSVRGVGGGRLRPVTARDSVGKLSLWGLPRTLRVARRGVCVLNEAMNSQCESCRFQTLDLGAGAPDSLEIPAEAREAGSEPPPEGPHHQESREHTLSGAAGFGGPVVGKP